MNAPLRCANKSCNRALDSCVGGRLFQFEVVSISLAANDEAAAPFDEKPARETMLFWLCGGCALRFSVSLEPARGLKLIPLADQNGSDSEPLGGFTAVLQQGNEC